MCVTFFWVGMDECDICLGWCGWVRHFSGSVCVGLTFFWVGMGGWDIFWVGVCGSDILLGGCVSV